MEPLVEAWLQDFKSLDTRKVYGFGLASFQRVLGFPSWEQYVAGGPDAVGDLRKFCEAWSSRPPNTVLTKITAVRSFLKDQGVNVDGLDWQRLVKRGFVPRSEVVMRDRIPTREELARVLSCSGTMMRAVILFCVSSGARVGESCAMRVDDLDLSADPPRAHLRGASTKNHRGRTVFMSREAAEVLRVWLKVKTKLKKKDGEAFSRDLVFGVLSRQVQYAWNNILRKADVTDRCSVTHRLRCHFHTLRKYFRTNIGLPPEYTEYLLGHSIGLDSAYFRPYESELEKLYLANMHRVSVFEGENEKVGRELAKVREENLTLQKRVQALDEKNLKIGELQGQVQGLNTAMLQMQSAMQLLARAIPEKKKG